MELLWHPYRYYDYERELALREVKTLLKPRGVRRGGSGIYVEKPRHPEAFDRLVYFAAASQTGLPVHTQQSLIERVNGNGPNRQSTRYSVHGLHEYKGKFNPQVAKAILNIFGAKRGQRAFDPFCGSGTSLVESVHLGLDATGADINPLAVYLANAKLASLNVPADRLGANGRTVIGRAKRMRPIKATKDERLEYLRAWFRPSILSDIERVRIATEQLDEPSRSILLAIASNLLRDYSLQEPQDLRIRRRKSPLPKEPFFETLSRATTLYALRLKETQATLGLLKTDSKAMRLDCRTLTAKADLIGKNFDFALTSPPYATALPYIDTQRLSLIWLDLLKPKDVMRLESELIGSREIRGSKQELRAAFEANVSQLPDKEVKLCLQLQNALRAGDGFRRKVVPSLLYRYFSSMAEAFVAIRRVMRPKAPFALIVGGNHTVLGGRRFDIQTPEHLVSIAVSRGWRHVETLQLQTYQRYGLHMNNSTTSESLLVLSA